MRKLAGSTEPGINRVWWDLRYESPIAVKLRNSPPGEPWVQNGPEGWRRLAHWRNFEHGPKVWPDSYTIKLNADGTVTTRTIDVLRDPQDDANEEQIKTNVEFLLQLRDELDQCAKAINHMEWSRKQLDDMKAMFSEDPKNTSVLEAINKVQQQILPVEEKFFPLALTGRIEDAFRAPTRLYGNLANLAFLVEGGADLPPTNQSVELNGELRDDLSAAQKAVQELDDNILGSFNSTLKARGMAVGDSALA